MPPAPADEVDVASAAPMAATAASASRVVRNMSLSWFALRDPIGIGCVIHPQPRSHAVVSGGVMRGTGARGNTDQLFVMPAREKGKPRRSGVPNQSVIE